MISIKDFIAQNRTLDTVDLILAYSNYRLEQQDSKIPYDVDIWLTANRLSEKEFCDWFISQRSKR